jgi:hypothetical protein
MTRKNFASYATTLILTLIGVSGIHRSADAQSCGGPQGSHIHLQFNAATNTIALHNQSNLAVTVAFGQPNSPN